MDILLAMLFMSTTSNFNLPDGLLSSLCMIESHHNPEAIHLDDSGTNSVGICQVKLSTAQFMGFKGTEKDLMHPAINIYYSGKYLNHQLYRYKGNIEKAVIAYNMGSTKHLTRTKYSVKVIKQWRKS